MAELTGRLQARIRADFRSGDADQVIGWLASLPAEQFGGQGPERIMAAVVLASHGRLDRFFPLLRLVKIDWRDVLVAGDLADEDWPSRLDVELPGP